VVTKYDYSNDALYYDSAARHTEAEDARVAKTVAAVIKNSECPGCTPGEKGLSRALANVIVEHIQPNPWAVVRGTSGWDVAKSLSNGVALPLGIVTLGAIRMNEKANSQTTINGKVNKFGHSFTKLPIQQSGKTPMPLLRRRKPQLYSHPIRLLSLTPPLPRPRAVPQENQNDQIKPQDL